MNWVRTTCGQMVALLVLAAACTNESGGDSGYGGPRAPPPSGSIPNPGSDAGRPPPWDAGAPLPDGGAPPADGAAPGDAGRPPFDAGAPDVPPANACPPSALPPGDHALSIVHGGKTRSFDLHVPAGALGQPRALVFYFHPLLMNKDYLMNAGGRAKSDKEGFVAVFAQGEGSSWNAGACCGPANGAGGKPAEDDIGFVRALLAEVSSKACVDRRRVYATGFSNGGFLSHRLACEAADLFAAVAPVSSVNGMSPLDCKPVRPVPVFSINGTTDTLVPYQGGFFMPGVTSAPFASVADTFGQWAARNGCSGTPHESYRHGTVYCESYTQCAGGAEVTLCTVDGAGHCWFGEPICPLGTNSMDIMATDATWEFLKRFALP